MTLAIPADAGSVAHGLIAINVQGSLNCKRPFPFAIREYKIVKKEPRLLIVVIPAFEFVNKSPNLMVRGIK